MKRFACFLALSMTLTLLASRMACARKSRQQSWQSARRHKPFGSEKSQCHRQSQEAGKAFHLRLRKKVKEQDWRMATPVSPSVL